MIQELGSPTQERMEYENSKNLSSVFSFPKREDSGEYEFMFEPH